MAKRAVVVGISNYPYPATTLQAAAEEAKRWADLLTSFDKYAFPASEVHLIPNTEATKSRVVGELAWLLGGATAGDQLVFVFNGHGTHVDVPRMGGGTKREEGLVLFPLPSSDPKAALEQAVLTG